jgi:hypothetical protein
LSKFALSLSAISAGVEAFLFTFPTRTPPP